MLTLKEKTQDCFHPSNKQGTALCTLLGCAVSVNDTVRAALMTQTLSELVLCLSVGNAPPDHPTDASELPEGSRPQSFVEKYEFLLDETRHGCGEREAAKPWRPEHGENLLTSQNQSQQIYISWDCVYTNGAGIRQNKVIF